MLSLNGDSASCFLPPSLSLSFSLLRLTLSALNSLCTVFVTNVWQFCIIIAPMVACGSVFMAVNSAQVDSLAANFFVSFPPDCPGMLEKKLACSRFRLFLS